MKPLSTLTNRIFLASALLAVVSIGIAIYVVNEAVTRQAEQELRRSVEEAATLVDHHRNLLFEHFTTEARLIADLPRLKAAVATDDPPTVWPIAEEYQRYIGADLFVVTNAEGVGLAEVGTAWLSGGPARPVRGVTEALDGTEATWFWTGGGGVLQVVSVPIWIDPDQPVMLGSLSVGFSLDEAVAERLKQLTHSEIAFAADARVQVSTIEQGDAAALETLLSSPGVSQIRIGDEDYVAVARPLTIESVRTAGESTPHRVGILDSRGPVTLVLRSQTERLQFLRPLQTALAGTAVVAVLAAVLLSYLVARTVTRPLATITAAMREMAATGNLNVRVPFGSDRWGDEDTRLLATTFNSLTESLSRFQREAAQRERLSSLGRLSTVVAHEIRNPLMIIKAAVRILRRHQADPAEVRAAADDVNEEVERLNRLVTEVLDFARPIKVELSMVDLNALCREAAEAAAAGDEGPAIHLQLDPAAAELETDRERLRLVLVNLINNARHASVLASRAPEPVGEEGLPGPAPPAGADAIELVTIALPGDAVAILVRDHGVGIKSEHLSQIFEPYFTTKRTGSGLGLAIAKNIVDGLGGTIAAHSRVGAGTAMRIELPRRSHAAREVSDASHLVTRDS